MTQDHLPKAPGRPVLGLEGEPPHRSGWSNSPSTKETGARGAGIGTGCPQAAPEVGIEPGTHLLLGLWGEEGADGLTLTCPCRPDAAAAGRAEAERAAGPRAAAGPAGPAPPAGERQPGGGPHARGEWLPGAGTWGSAGVGPPDKGMDGMEEMGWGAAGPGSVSPGLLGAKAMGGRPPSTSPGGGLRLVPARSPGCVSPGTNRHFCRCSHARATEFPGSPTPSPSALHPLGCEGPLLGVKGLGAHPIL